MPPSGEGLPSVSAQTHAATMESATTTMESAESTSGAHPATTGESANMSITEPTHRVIMETVPDRDRP